MGLVRDDQKISLPSAPTSEASCCTCATFLCDLPRFVAGSEKPLPENRDLSCCRRVICGLCLYKNARFALYCPYCQTTSSSSTSSTSTPPSAISAPPPPPPPISEATNPERPSTDDASGTSYPDDPPPPYTPDPSALPHPDPTDKKGKQQPDPPAEDTLHFLHHPHDTIASLSLRYGVPAPVLRRANNLSSDHLLAARRTILIPASHYRAGVSLSPRPVAGEDDERRKARLRRFMVACKVHDYDVALLYLEQADYDLAAAVDAYRADDVWERENPLRSELRSKPKRAAGWKLFGL
ncbi:hypothetical protein SODALDRAFT_290610 [Sodiomyces alkalinus F11]|uniref:LysM domain-containing protein n=1 Tax=Sodiomyces alkalinus (strain CBS 110278 / VKM F-3762 / F11) TaxID=1314773 RepID=A0A3N2Q109_SODAK|nr:hypothetical protein SODALDRAFT_290610 [Sodiomyces alkalinus F11]ROT40396.1 hypothetical protein SODALDRAFT_290610 [Sodiomyces alkalinus F11]